MKIPRCGRPGCTNRLERPLGAVGRPSRFCSSACRQAGYRRRKSTSIHFSSKSPEWYTDPAFFGTLAEKWGPFDLDPATDPRSPIWSLVPHHFTASENGLLQPWFGRVFLNPPYGRKIRAWIDKAIAELAAGRVVLVAMLVPARPDTAWWHTAKGAGGEPDFIRGRLRFYKPDGTRGDAAAFPSATLLFRNGFVTGDDYAHA